MKKTPKKLALRRDTLLALDDRSGEAVQGATSAFCVSISACSPHPVIHHC